MPIGPGGLLRSTTKDLDYVFSIAMLTFAPCEVFFLWSHAD